MGDLEYILLLLYVEVPLAISHGSISTFDGQELLPKKVLPDHCTQCATVTVAAPPMHPNIHMHDFYLQSAAIATIDVSDLTRQPPTTRRQKGAFTSFNEIT